MSTHTPRRRRRKQPRTNIDDPMLYRRKGTAAVQSEGVNILSDSATLLDYSWILALVFGGCCTNVWSFEALLTQGQRVGSALTFSQMLFITLQSLPSFIDWTGSSTSGKSEISRAIHHLPRLKPRQVPLQQWALQVSVLSTGSLLNNWALEYRVPLSLQIVFRASGLPVSMALGYLFLRRRYSIWQIASVMLVTGGVILATLARPSAAARGQQLGPDYLLGISMLTASLLLTGILGLLQERTYQKYGPCWKEGVFYTHMLSLPVFMFFMSDVVRGFHAFAGSSSSVYGIPGPFLVLPMNLVTQLLCVSGVNQLTSRVSSVTTNLVLTTRKAMSLCLSVWMFNHDWNAGLGFGAGMVFFGSLWYTSLTARGR